MGTARARCIPALLLWAGAACAQAPAPEPAPGPSAPGRGTPTATATATAPVAETASPAPAPAGRRLDPSLVDAAFLPFDDGCSTDADCVVTETGLAGRLACCDGCDAVAGTAGSVARANAVCAKRRRQGQVGPCPPRDCAAPRAACVGGHCVVR